MFKRLHRRSSRQWRLILYTAFIFLLAAVLIGRLFVLQIVRGKAYVGEARQQQESISVIKPQRGEIYMQDKEGNLYPVATNKRWPLVYAVPRDIEDPEQTSRILSPILGVPAEQIRERISKRGDPYEPLLAKASDEVVRRLKEADMPGIGIQYDLGRYYPLNTSASHVLGFVGYSGDKRVGQYGVEEYYQDVLMGKEGVVQGEKSGSGYWIALGKRLLNIPKNGSDLVLTLDQNIQFKAEEILGHTVEKWNAASGSVIVSNPKTGRILAMASLPNFDLNSYGSVEDIEVFVNPAVQFTFEPGSIFKPITMAGALDSRSVTPETTYEDTGQEIIDGYVIQNFDKKARGIQTMTQVLEKSLNTGAIFAERKMGHKTFRDYVGRFGFGKKTGIDLNGEVEGDVSNLSVDRDVNYATASFGQGISVTPVQIVQAIGAIANGGKLMKPFVVDKIIPSGGGKEYVNEPEVVREVMSSKASYQLTAMMASVIENGAGRGARVKGYVLAGKTGTAQIPDPEKGGYSDEVIHSFVGFGPAYDPQFLIFFKLDKPRGIRFAASSLAPAFRELSEFILNYYGIAPDIPEQQNQ